MKLQDQLNLLQQKVLKNQWEWAEQFEPIIQDVICSRLACEIGQLRRATEQEDTKEATDMVFELIGKGSVACRMRKYEFFKKYGDFTVRYPHERRKILNGWCRWYFYSWANESEDDLEGWLFVCLDSLRNSGLLSENRQVILNKDGTKFVSIKVPELHKYNCVIDFDMPVTSHNLCLYQDPLL